MVHASVFQCGTGCSISQVKNSQQAVDLFFTLPDDPCFSEDEGYSSSNNEVHSDFAPTYEVEPEAPEPSCSASAAKRKSYQRKKSRW